MPISHSSVPSFCSLLASSSHSSYSNWVGCTDYTSLILRKATQSDTTRLGIFALSVGRRPEYCACGRVPDPCVAWMVAWNSSNLKLAHVFVIANTLTQLYYMIAKLPPMDRRSTFSLDTHCLQNFCQHRCPRLSPQRICGLL
jgi:hypothetical protein